VGAGRGLDGQSCRAATSLTVQSAGSAPRVPVFRRPAAAGGPPGHPAYHPGGWLRADKVPVRRHRVRHLLNRSGCCRGGRQIAGQAPAGVCQQLERGRRRLTGQVTRPRRTVSAGLTHLRHRTWADRTPAEILPSRVTCSPPGPADRENGHLTIRSVQPGARVTRARSAGRPGQHRHLRRHRRRPAVRHQHLHLRVEDPQGPEGHLPPAQAQPQRRQHPHRRLPVLIPAAPPWRAPATAGEPADSPRATAGSRHHRPASAGPLSARCHRCPGERETGFAVFTGPAHPGGECHTCARRLGPNGVIE